MRNVYLDPNWSLFYEGNALVFKVPTKVLKPREVQHLIFKWLRGLKIEFPEVQQPREPINLTCPQS